MTASGQLHGLSASGACLGLCHSLQQSTRQAAGCRRQHPGVHAGAPAAAHGRDARLRRLPAAVPGAGRGGSLPGPGAPCLRVAASVWHVGCSQGGGSGLGRLGRDAGKLGDGPALKACSASVASLAPRAEQRRMLASGCCKSLVRSHGTLLTKPHPPGGAVPVSTLQLMPQGFAATVDAILANLPRTRQTLLFSATQTKRVRCAPRQRCAQQERRAGARQCCLPSCMARKRGPVETEPEVGTQVRDLARLSLRNPEYVAVHAEASAPTPLKLKQARHPTARACTRPCSLQLWGWRTAAGPAAFWAAPWRWPSTHCAPELCVAAAGLRGVRAAQEAGPAVGLCQAAPGRPHPCVCFHLQAGRLFEALGHESAPSSPSSMHMRRAARLLCAQPCRRRVHQPCRSGLRAAQAKLLWEVLRRLRPGAPLRCLHGKMKQMKRMAVYYEFCQARLPWWLTRSPAARDHLACAACTAEADAAHGRLLRVLPGGPHIVVIAGHRTKTSRLHRPSLRCRRRTCDVDVRCRPGAAR